MFESTQGVGGLFRSEPVPIATSGSYEFTVADLQFPAALGIERAGDHARHGAGRADLRRLQSVAPAGGGNLRPELHRSARRGPVARHVWIEARGRAAGADGDAHCESAHGHRRRSDDVAVERDERDELHGCERVDGSKNTSGTEQSAALNANATFELSCSGPGGTTSASASVVVNARSGGGGGGGGSSRRSATHIYVGARMRRRVRAPENCITLHDYVHGGATCLSRARTSVCGACSMTTARPSISIHLSVRCRRSVRCC